MTKNTEHNNIQKLHPNESQKSMVVDVKYNIIVYDSMIRRNSEYFIHYILVQTCYMLIVKKIVGPLLVRGQPWCTNRLIHSCKYVPSLSFYHENEVIFYFCMIFKDIQKVWGLVVQIIVVNSERIKAPGVQDQRLKRLEAWLGFICNNEKKGNCTLSCVRDLRPWLYSLQVSPSHGPGTRNSVSGPVQKLWHIAII